MLNRRLFKNFRRERLQDCERSHNTHLNMLMINISTVLPTLLGDINTRMEAWGLAGKMDPYKDIYDLVFQMSIRMASCEELATDVKSIQNIRNLHSNYEKSITPTSLLLPWFPSTARKDKETAIRSLHSALSHYVNIRRKAETRNSHTIDVLIADGADNATIVEVCVSILLPQWALMV